MSTATSWATGRICPVVAASNHRAPKSAFAGDDDPSFARLGLTISAWVSSSQAVSPSGHRRGAIIPFALMPGRFHDLRQTGHRLDGWRTQTEHAVPALHGVLGQTDDRETLKLVIEVLGIIGGPSVINTLAEFLYSADRELTIASIQAMRVVGTPTVMTWLDERMGTPTCTDCVTLLATARDHGGADRGNGCRPGR
jgi:hypothetical protein